ncbi:heme binding [Homalodisca vitripennis]|nr:heme binding [Homalodisca vitripennis]
MFLFYSYYRRKANYWVGRGVPYEDSHWYLGSFLGVLTGREKWNDTCSRIYNSHRGSKFVGVTLYGIPGLFALDPEMVEAVLVQDFSHFHERGIPKNPREPLSNSLSTLSGQKWRSLRNKLTPAFSPGRVKGMFEQILRCGDRIVDRIEDNSGNEEGIEMQRIVFKYTTQVIASCTAGIEFDSDCELWKTFMTVVDLITKASPKKMAKHCLAIAYPRIMMFLNFPIIDKLVTDFFLSLTRSALKFCKCSKTKRNDFLHVMLTLKDQEVSDKAGDVEGDFDQYYQGEDKQMPTNEVFTEFCIASMLYNFVAAGITPSVNTISLALFELARDPGIQRRAQQEIQSCISKYKGLTYEATREMVYLDQIIQETLRLYPARITLVRMATDNYQIPGTDLVLEPGAVIYIPIAAIQRDPQYYPDPDTFKPERFAGNNYKSSAIFAPFDHGPRICIAIKFAVLTIKICIAKILSKYTVRIGSRMQLPLQFEQRRFILKVEGGIWLKLYSRRDA